MDNRLLCKAGKAVVTKMGDLKGCDTVWFFPQGIAIILSLYNFLKKYKVTYHSFAMTRSIVHKFDGNMYLCATRKICFTLMLRTILHMS